MGLVAAVYSAIGGLIVGIGLAIFVAAIRKGRNPDASFFATFFATAFVAVPACAIGIFVLFFMFMSSQM